MKLVVNGTERTAEAGLPLSDWVASLGLDPARVAVEYNGALLDIEAWPHTTLSEGDRLEIVHFVGGG